VFIFSLLIIIIAIGAIAVSSIQTNLDNLKNAELNDLGLSVVPDGTYYGEYSAFPVSVEVSVTILNHEIQSIEIFKHDNGQGAPAEVIIDTVIEEQSVQVDTVAGATYSSYCILLAIQDAIDLGD